MAIAFQANFTAANNTDVTTLTPTTGAPLVDYLPTVSITNNRARRTGNQDAVQTNETYGSADYTVRMVVRYLGSDSTSSSSIHGRFLDVGNTIAATIKADGTIDLYRANGYSWTTLGTYTIPSFLPNTDYTVELVLSGTNVSAKLNGATILGPYTESDIVAARQAGLSFDNSTGADATTTGFHVSEFVVYTGTLSVGGVTATDNFDRSNGSLIGSTMSGGIYTWDATGGSWVINANQASINNTGVADYVAYANNLPDCAIQTVSAKLYSSDSGVVGRYNVSSGIGTFYMAYWSGGDLTIYKCLAGTYSNLAAGGTASAGDIVTLDCNGTLLKLKVNGVDIVSITDPDISTGKAGLYSGGTTKTYTFDDFSFVSPAVIVGGSVIRPLIHNAPGLSPFTINRLLGV